MAFFKVDILTPNKVLAVNLPADSLFIPTTKGIINVLPDHTHLMAKLDTGICTLIEGEEKTYFSMTTGICKILKNKVVFLSKASEAASDIDLERSRASLERSKKKLSTEAISDFDLVKWNRKQERALMRMSLAKLYKGM